jgi:cystathionine beta-lyase family protein involved in aluminum resistance
VSKIKKMNIDQLRLHVEDLKIKYNKIKVQNPNSRQLNKIKKEIENSKNLIEIRLNKRYTRVNQVELPLGVSDHAVIKFIERVKGINLDDIRLELSEMVANAMGGLTQCGSAEVVTKNCVAHVKDGTIVTIINKLKEDI